MSRTFRPTCRLAARIPAARRFSRTTVLAAEVIALPELGGDAVESILECVFEHDPERASGIASDLFERGMTGVDCSTRARAVGAGSALFNHRPAIAWPLLSADFEKGGTLAGPVFEAVSDRVHRRKRNSVVSELGPQSVVDLYLALARRYPPSEDPDVRGPHAVSMREELSDCRESLLRSVVDSGHPDSIEALKRVCAAFPERNLEHLVERAEDRVLEETWEPVQPATLKTFLEKASRRFVDPASSSWRS